MRLHFLVTSEGRAQGAMFMKSLEDTVLAFIYPTADKRTFHTFFCPPLRIVALDADGQEVFNEVITKWQFVKLPACCHVLETAPQADYRPFIQAVLSVTYDLPQRAAMEPNAHIDGLLFALISEAVADMRRIREVHRGKIKPETQRRKFEAWERGRIVSSAGFLLDFSSDWKLPEGAVKLSRSILQVEKPYLDELVAASIAGIPWRQEFPSHCMRCGKPASWHPVLDPPEDAPIEILWRYQRPENAVPICHHCTETLNFLLNESLRLDLVWGLWGPRFEAFWQWHRAVKNNHLPDWDCHAFPLWPHQYGGQEWETGSGALTHAIPRPPGDIRRNEQHMTALRRALYSKPFRGRQPGEAPLQKLLDFRIDTSEGEPP
jgi:hypothetical protein